MTDYYPQRIVCLTEETTEMLYLLGEEHRIVGISGFTVRPPRARKEKPMVSAFTSADIPAILALKPDLVLGFSDLQADIAADLVREGIDVHIFNQRSVKEILGMILTLGAMVGQAEQAHDWVAAMELRLQTLRQSAALKSKKPKVYFEEWFDPIISSIQWVSELVEIAGGECAFPELAVESLAKNRIIEDAAEVVRRAPDIIIGSWCGRKFQPDRLCSRDGWSSIPAVQNNQVHEIKSAYILQPGPAALTDGLDQIKAILDAWHDET
ncbi:MAG: cobalamin-binding protein [Planctomycetota bacterium]|nr:MAG: cobalamin-binding protein [Planctomycetota bacterium]